MTVFRGLHLACKNYPINAFFIIITHPRRVFLFARDHGISIARKPIFTFFFIYSNILQDHTYRRLDAQDFHFAPGSTGKFENCIKLPHLTASTVITICARVMW